MRLALVHDWLVNLGGAERVLIELHKIFPDAPIYTLFYDKKFKSEYLFNAEIKSSYLQKFPFINKFYKYTALLMPSAMESFDLSSFDLVISSSVFFSKGLILRPRTRHICYCYSPTRQLWDLATSNKQQTTGDRLAKHFLRLWDRQAADRVDEFVAISECVRERIKKYYKKDARV
ncbi:MAG: glycosyltransferase, partial [Candidatus Paceibacteria bacterium]